MKNTYKISHILLVDDDHDDCELFGEALHELDAALKLSCLTENEELIVHIEKKAPDIIFLDINMPKKNGYECLQEIKEEKRFSNIPVVMYSNTNRPEDIDKAYKNGAVLFLRKPATYSRLVELIKGVINKEWSHPASITAQYFLNGKYHSYE